MLLGRYILVSNLDSIDIFNFENCICKNLRMTSRLITQFYDKLLHPTGLRATQFALLTAIMSHADISIGELASILLMDQTTVTRNVEILRKKVYINVRIGNNDSRRRYISISEIGEKKLTEAILLWKEAQSQIEGKIGADKFEELLKTLAFINNQF
jgi:DNA-binding MarR family transcriptional regulator